MSQWRLRGRWVLVGATAAALATYQRAEAGAATPTCFPIRAMTIADGAGGQ